jgi:hypothetical protein
VIPKLHSCPSPLQTFTLVVSPRLGLQQISVNFNFGVTKPKVNALKTKVRHNISNNIIKDLIDLKINISNNQLKKSK